MIDAIRIFERSIGLPSAWGFVPQVSWPSERLARALHEEGCEVYWHDLAHDARLPYMRVEAITAAFAEIDRRSPWARELIHSFRAGQLLVSPALMQAIGTRFVVDLSIPDTERGGPYGGTAGCGTVVPFSYRGFLEVPLTLPQDVFIRHVYGYSPSETLELWTRKLDHVVAVGGVATMVLHPAWSHPKSDLWDVSRSFLESMMTRQDIFITTPYALARDVFGFGQ